MRIRFSTLLAFTFVAFSCAREAAPPTDTSRAEQSPPTPTAAPSFEWADYQFGLLRKGPTHGTGTEAEIAKMQAGHMANIEKMARSGKLMAAGPMGDDGNLRGIFLFNASASEARALAAEDPSIQAGRLVLELHAWHGPKGIGAKLNEEYRQDPTIKMTMTEYFLVLLTKGPKAEEGSVVEQEKLQHDHLLNVRRMLDAKTFVAAGPFEGTGEARGIFVIAAKSIEEARTIADADPAVKAGQLSAEIHPWWVAKEVWPE